MSLRWFFLFLSLLNPCLVQCELFRVGWQAPQNAQSVYNISNYTFEHVGQQLDTDFEIVPYQRDTDLVDAMAAGSIDFIYASPTTVYCAIVKANIQPLATIVNLANGRPYNSLTGSVITLNSSGINSVSGVVGRVVGAGQLTGLTTFQSELDLLLQRNISLFTQSRAIVAYASSATTIQALLNRDIDIGFVEASQLMLAASKGMDVSSIVVVEGKYQNNTPFLSTTQTFSSSALAAAQYINNTFRTRVVAELLSLRPEDPVCVAGKYFGWYIPQSFLTIRKLMQSTGLLNPSTMVCNDLSDVYGFVNCPPGYAKKDNAELMGSCRSTGFVCPPDSILCVCSPCEKIQPPQRVGTLLLVPFVVILLVLVVLSIAVTIVSVMVVNIHRNLIPFKELHVQDMEVGRSIKGRVLMGTYRNIPVVVKRVLPCRSCHPSVFDHDDMPERAMCWKAERHRSLFVMWDLYSCARAYLSLASKSQRLIRKIGRARKIRHPNMLPVLGCSLGPHFDELLVAVEYAESGTLADILNNQTIKTDEATEISLSLDIAKGMAHLHCLDPPVYTRNLRSHRIFVDQDMRAKIGMSFTPFNRSSLWNPPEVIRGGPQTDASNVYKYGMLLYEIAFRRLPFSFAKTTEQQAIEAILQADETNAVDALPTPTKPHPLTEVMRRCWCLEPEDRPSFTRICNDLLTVLPPQARVGRSNSMESALLDTIIPPQVAEQMRLGKKVEPQHFDSCSIFFSDVVGYTTIASFLTTNQVVDMLGRLYSAFEDLVTKYDLFKVETIGDSFMVAANILRDHQTDHAARLVRFALDAMHVARTIPVDLDNPSRGNIKIRAGIHSGKCVATVIGKQAPRYCLFGDCVNVASRMESNSLPNRLNISHECRKLVQMQDPTLQAYLYRRPGKVDIKGKGRMVCHWVMSPREAETRGFKQDAASEMGSRHGSTNTSMELKSEELKDVVVQVEPQPSPPRAMSTIHEHLTRRSHSAESLQLEFEPDLASPRRSLDSSARQEQAR